MVRPRPNRMPETTAQTMAGMRSAPQDVACDKHSDAAARHEQAGGDDGADGEACDATDAMTTGAAAAESRTEAHQHAADQDHRDGGIEADDWRPDQFQAEPG